MSFLHLWAQNLPAFWQGVEMTLELTALALLLAVAFGFVLALMRLSRLRLLSLVATIYIEVVRAIPVLVLLFVAYYSLGQIGIQMSGFTAAVITLGVYYATLYGEIFRGGIEGVQYGQREAAEALGMGSQAIMRRIVLPQAFLAILPPATNELADLIKDTSLVVTIGVADLMFQAYQASAANFHPMDMFLLAGIMYFVFYLVLSQFLTRWETNVQRRRG
ncbi:MAG: amino acid ABC transporter permease [Thermaerobacter sp.]|nr:amino acid ABC transporter permease [Thermaerobacter sp.]